LCLAQLSKATDGWNPFTFTEWGVNQDTTLEALENLGLKNTVGIIHWGGGAGGGVKARRQNHF